MVATTIDIITIHV